MNSKFMAALFAIVAIGSLGVVGIVNNIPSVDARVSCNPSTEGCPPPGQSDFNNLGQCKQYAQDLGYDKEGSRTVCKNHLS